MSGAYNRDAAIYFLERIWPGIQIAIPEVKVVFIGNSPAKILKKMASENSNVEYTGYVEDVRPFIAISAIFIAPLRIGSGTKVKVLNAMSQGKLIITTSVGA